MPDIRISLRTLRSELDVTQEEFAKMINMSLHTYRKKETGETSFTLEEAYRISQVARKSIDEIFLRFSDHNGQKKKHLTKI